MNNNIIPIGSRKKVPSEDILVSTIRPQLHQSVFGRWPNDIFVYHVENHRKSSCRKP